MNIQGASILITGGSRGLGLALARSLALKGARVVITGRAADTIDAAVREIRRLGGEAFGIAADIADKQAIQAIAGEAAALVGPIDIFIQNASTLGPVPLRLLLDTECEDLEAVLDVNLIGPFRLARILVGSMALRGRGLMLSITSDASVEAYSGWGAYSISKAGLDHLTRLLAAELHDTGVRFLSVDPGEMNTQMHADAVPEANPESLSDPNDVAQQILEIIRRSDNIPNGSRLIANQVEVLQ
jgi:NAD(P)-dependent dehydrogenase (short-subunit alcohol dehydrogenase family)